MMIFMTALSFCVSAKHLSNLSKCFCVTLAQRRSAFLKKFLIFDTSKLSKFCRMLQTFKLFLVI